MSFRYRHQRRQEDHSTDDWLMTYADMITLLLCFFAIFLSVSVPKKDVFNQAKEEVLERFASSSFHEMPFDTLTSIIDEYQGQEHRTGDQVDASDTDQGQGREEVPPGDRLMTIDMPSATLFSSGSAELSNDGKMLLLQVLEKNIKNNSEDYLITVEGHTDDVPIKTMQFPSNWELSTARAAVVVRFFIDQGIAAQRLRVAGYADSFPKVPNRNALGIAVPANQAENRRVVIKLEKIVKGSQP